MIINWFSETSEILLNPCYPKKFILNAKNALPLEGRFAKHLWLATSGSTAESGSIKYVAISKDAFLASAKAVNEHLNLTPKDIWVNPLPHFHVGGLSIHARAFLNGAQVILFNQKWNAKNFHQTLQETNATFSSLVPAQVYDLVAAHLKAPPSLSGIIVGGGKLSTSLYEQAYTLGWKLLPSYGLTEASSQVATACLSTQQYPSMKILPHLAVHVDENGFLCLKGPSLLTCYAYLSPASCQLIDPKVNGWLKTEDKGEVLGDQLKIFGRDSDFFKIGGESVDLKHLEEILEKHKLTLDLNCDVALLAMEDPRLGHTIHLAVGSSLHRDVSELVDNFNQTVLPFERIRKVHYLKSLPRSPLNKLLRNVLVKRISIT